MVLLCWTALLLGLLLRGHAAGYHSLRYVYTGVSEPSPGLPQFISVGYVDGQLFIHYDSEKKKVRPAVPWIEKVDMEDHHYWDRERQNIQGSESAFRRSLVVLRNRYNQSGGFHTFQRMYGCDLNEDGHSRGYIQYGYEGREFLAFDKETLTWTATDAAALTTKMKWEADPALTQHQKAYLEEDCVEWLQKYLRYGKETLLRKEPPIVKVTRKDSHEGWETLLCQAHGFYPKEIDITWRKDGEVKQEDTFCGVVSPNADGTYYTWLSIEVDPKVRSRYQCHVEHDGLQEPLDVTMEESAPLPIFVMAVGVSVCVLVLNVVAGLVLYRKKRLEKTNKVAEPGKDQGRTLKPTASSDSSFCWKLKVEGQNVNAPHALARDQESLSSTDRESEGSADSLIPSQCGKQM